MQQLIDKAAEYVKLKLYNEPSGHDWYHVKRVWRLAQVLQEAEGGDLQLIELAVVLRDLGGFKCSEAVDEKKELLILDGMMDILEIEDDLRKKITKIVRDSHFHGEDTKPADTIEGKIVQDATWLDALGAIGLARTFATGGIIGRPINDPERKVRKKISNQVYWRQKREGSSVNTFYEKIFKFAEMLNTVTAKKIAAGRVKFMKDYLAQFNREWEGKDIVL